MQTYDLAAVAYGIDDFSIIGAYVFGVNTIGDDGYDYGQGMTLAAPGSGGTTSVIVNASYKIMDPIKVTGYAYLLGSITDTYGLAATGKIAAGDSTKINYRAEVAMQTGSTLEHAQLQPKTEGMDSMYMNLDVGANISGFLVGLNYEVLGGQDKDDTVGTAQFITPLATKHKFNGWADVFLNTPGTGLADLNVRGGYKFDTAGKIIAVYHMFGAAADGNGGMKDPAKDIKAGDAYGSEFDIAYSSKIPGVTGLKGLLKGAMYMGDDATNTGARDKTMVWAQLDYKFSI